LVLESNVLELNRTGKMEKEYVFSPSGAKLAYLKDNEVIWMHSEPSGKESYEIKQDRTATKATYDPTGAAVTNFGYNGGAACPPNTCNSGYNSQIIGAWTFIDGLFILSQQRNAERLQSRQFEILTTPIGWEGSTDHGKTYPNYIPNAEQARRFDGKTRPIYGFFIPPSPLPSPPPPGKATKDNPYKNLKKFLKKNPNCKKALKELGINIKDFFKTQQFIDASQPIDDLDKTLTELGGDASILTGLFLDPNQKLGEQIKNAFAVTIIGGGKIYLNYGSETRIERGETIVHELFHAFFKTDHVGIAQKLGYDIQHDYTTIKSEFDLGKFVKGKWIPNIQKFEITLDKNDGKASQIINEWLANNCQIK
jgi:hypothetical protein